MATSVDPFPSTSAPTSSSNSAATHKAVPTFISRFTLRASRFAPWAIPLALTLLLLPRLYLLLTEAITRISWPWQIDYGEGTNLDAAYLLSQGYNIYRHNGPDSFISAPYPPFYYLLLAPFQSLFGPSFAAGRILSFLSTLLIAALIAYILFLIGRWMVDGRRWPATTHRRSRFAFRVSRLALPSLLAPALWLSLSPVIVWSALFRQDLPSLALDLAGLALILRATTRHSSLVTRQSTVYRLPSALALLLFTLAFYTKQTSLAGAAAASLWLLLRDWRHGLRFTLPLAASILIPFAALNLILQGGLWEHLITYHLLPDDGSDRRFTHSITLLWREYWPTLLVAFASFAALLLAALPRRKTNPFPRLILWSRTPYALIIFYTIFGWASSLATLGSQGAIFNHLLDGLIPTCILVGLAAHYPIRLLSHPHPRTKLTGLALLAAFSALFIVQITLFQPPQNWLTTGWPSDDRANELQGFSTLVAHTPGDIYSEDAYLLLANGKRPVYEDASTFSQLALEHKWDDTAFIRAIRDRRFSLVLFYQGNLRWTPQELDAFGDNYTLKFPGSIEVYAPDLFPHHPQYPLSCTFTRQPDSVTLTGYSLPPAVATDGFPRDDTLRIRLYWQTHAPLTTSYPTFVHLLREDGTFAAGQDNPATGAPQPTTRWPTSQIITDTASIPLPTNLIPGRYRLVTGIYALNNGAPDNLTPTCTEGDPYGTAVSLGWILIKP